MSSNDFLRWKENYDFASISRTLTNAVKCPVVLRPKFSEVSRPIMLVLIFVWIQQMAYLTLCKILNFSVPHFLHLWNGSNSSKEPYGVFVRNNALILVKHLELLLAYECSVRIGPYYLRDDQWESTVSTCVPLCARANCEGCHGELEDKGIHNDYTKGHKAVFWRLHSKYFWLCGPQSLSQLLNTAVVAWKPLTILKCVNMLCSVRHCLLTRKFEHHMIFTSWNIAF